MFYSWVQSYTQVSLGLNLLGAEQFPLTCFGNPCDCLQQQVFPFGNQDPLHLPVQLADNAQAAPLPHSLHVLAQELPPALALIVWSPEPPVTPLLPGAQVLLPLTGVALPAASGVVVLAVACGPVVAVVVVVVAVAVAVAVAVSGRVAVFVVVASVVAVAVVFVEVAEECVGVAVECVGVAVGYEAAVSVVCVAVAEVCVEAQFVVVAVAVVFLAEEFWAEGAEAPVSGGPGEAHPEAERVGVAFVLGAVAETA